jgi:hypothetical protein
VQSTLYIFNRIITHDCFVNKRPWDILEKASAPIA